MNFNVKQLVVDIEDSFVRFIEDIEQIQEDLLEEEKEFSNLEELKERLKSDLKFLEELKGMSNVERNKFLDEIYEMYFNLGIPREVIEEENRILEAYYNGELVESENTY